MYSATVSKPDPEECCDRVVWPLREPGAREFPYNGTECVGVASEGNVPGRTEPASSQNGRALFFADSRGVSGLTMLYRGRKTRDTAI